MTTTGNDSSPEPESNRDDDTTHIAQRDATRELPVQPPQQSTWSGGSSPVGSREDEPTQAAAPSAYPSAPQAAAGGYPSAPPSGQSGYSSAPAPDAYSSAAPHDSRQAPSSAWSSPQQPEQPYGAPGTGPFNGQGGQSHSSSAPQGAWSSQPQQPYGSGTPAQGYPSQQPYGSAPAGSGGNSQGTNPQTPSFGALAGQGPYGQPASGAYGQSNNQAYSSTPYGAPTAQTGASVKHQVSPLEKFGPFLPAFVALLGAFLTWATFKSGGQTVSLNGIGGNSNTANADLGGAKSTGGWLTIVCALALAGVAVAAILGKLKSMIVAIATGALSALVFIIGCVQFANVSSIVNSDAGSGYSGTIGIGVWLTVFAGLVGLGLAIFGFVVARRHKGSGQGGSTSTSAAPWSQAGANTNAPAQQPTWGQGR